MPNALTLLTTLDIMVVSHLLYEVHPQ